jgi:xylulokinase
MYLIGYDIGSSSIKAALVEAATGLVKGIVQYPEQEMPIAAPSPEQAEQHPELWWECVIAATRKLLVATGVASSDIGGIGIAYQMHGLVLVDRGGKVLRPSIIWCDSRAVGIGQAANDALGGQFCLEHYLNAPGNFTASKMRWVIEQEPQIAEKVHKMMLPGDYIAYRMTNEICTTITGLSEGILWDFQEQTPACHLMDHYGIPSEVLPEIRPAFSQQGRLTEEAADLLGLAIGTPVCYRAGDQPNNALCLNVLRPGEVAATGGTSGVVYAVAEKPCFDPQSRVNSFAHVNYTKENPLTGVLLCINGSGIQYNWMRRTIGQGQVGYDDMEKSAAAVPVGAEGLTILPFGNGAERMLCNRNPGAQISGLQFNRHTPGHFYRAALEGIAFSFVYGIDIMRAMGVEIRQLRVGGDNLFRSAVFSNTIATLTGAGIEVVNTTGAVGAARAAGVAAGCYASVEEALQHLPVQHRYEPLSAQKAMYQGAYQRFAEQLE